MKIGELAQRANCSTETVRYYEKEGLLPTPQRTGGNYRSYQPFHLERLRLIRNCRMLDMTHEEIRTLLGHIDDSSADCGPVNALLDDHIGHVATRIKELQQLQKQLLAIRRQCGYRQAVGDCGIVHGLAAMETEGKHPSATHLG